MPSKMITDRQKTAADLSGTVNQYAGHAFDILHQLLEPGLQEGDQIPDLALFQRLLSRRLDLLREELIRIDRTHRRELKGDRAARMRRDAAAEELRKLVARVRGVVDGSCGPGTCAQVLDVEGSIPTDPVVLHRVATDLVEALREGALADPDFVLAGMQLDTSAWADQLEQPLADLGEALALLTHEKPDTRERQVAKARAIAEYDRTYLATARIVEDLFRYVGMDDLGEKVRPSRRSTASPEEPELDLPEEAPEASPENPEGDTDL